LILINAQMNFERLKIATSKIKQTVMCQQVDTGSDGNMVCVQITNAQY